MCQEILSLSNSFVETPNRVFNNTTYWGVLPTITTKLSSHMSETVDGGGNSKDIDTLSKLTSSVFNNHDQNKEEYTVDYALLDDNVIGALIGEERDIIGEENMNLEETNDTVVEYNEVEEDIAIRKSKITKIRKAVIH